MIGRRAFVGAVIASVPLPFSDAFAQAQTFDSEFEKLKNDEFLLANTQAFGLIRDELTESRGTVRIRQRSDRKISQRASDLIIVFEVTSKETYTRKYQGVIRPGGESGITCGIGYDVGYVTEEYLREDWVGFISDTDIKALSIACGVTGNAAQALRRRLSQIQIPYDVAVNQFFDRVLPFYVAATLFALPRAYAY